MNLRKMLLLLAITFSLVALTAPMGFADDSSESGYQWNDKLARGAVNAVTCPIEIIRGIDLTSKEEGPAKGWTIGFVKGLAGGVMRLGAGIVDFVTFPFNWPDKDKAPIVKPNYVWEDWSGTYMK